MRSSIAKTLAIIILLANSPVWSLPQAAAAQEKKRVLIFNSYHPGYYWSDKIMEGMKSVLTARDDVVLHVEFMDTKRYYTPGYFDLLQELYAQKYRHMRVDAILTSDDHALDFVLATRQRLFPGAPVVFCGIDRIHASRLAGHKNIVGVEENLDFETNLRLALRLHPRTARVAVLSDHTKTGLTMLDEVRGFQHKFDDSLEFRYLTNLTVEETRSSLASLPSDTVVLYLSFIRDRNGQVLSLEESMDLIGKSSPVPVYLTWEMPIPAGIMGGNIVSGYKQGTTSASLVARILDGAPIESLPRLQTGPRECIFNYPVMRAFGLRKTDLPKGSIVIREPYSFYRQHKALVWEVVTAFIALSALVVVLSVNIFRRKRAESELLASETRLRTLLDTANEGFWEINPDTTIVDANPEMGEILGLPRGRIIGNNACDFMDEHSAHTFSEHMIQRKAGHRSSYEVRFTRPSGDIVYCLIKGSPLFDDESHITGSFAMITDITDRKKVEAELQISKKVLARSESMYRAISEYSAYGILLLARDEIVYNNRRMAHFLGSGEKPATKAALDRWITDEDRELFRTTLEELLSEHSATPRRFEFRGTRKGAQRDYHAHAQTMAYDEQTLIHMFIEDVTDQKEMARRARFNEMRMYHEDRLSALGVMATGIAHELNQPLNTVRVLADGLLFGRDEGWPLNVDEVYDNLGMISRQVVRMSGIIENIRDFARDDDRSSDIQESSPNQAIENVFSMLGRQLDAHGIAVEKELEQGLPSIGVNLNRLEQVIMNLVVNARQALDECDKQEKTLWIRSGARFGQIFIEVGDNASGIPEKDMAKVFDPFYTTKDVGKGTGLGLSISKTIVSEFRGRLESYNNTRGGATFFITVPGGDPPEVPDAARD